jgi:hypothetical protein
VVVASSGYRSIGCSKSVKAHLIGETWNSELGFDLNVAVLVGGNILRGGSL